MRKNCLRAKMNKFFQKHKKFEGKGRPNLLQRNFKIDQPNKVWLSDISYIKTTQGFVYLAAVLDLFSRKVVGWKVEDHMRVDLVEEALTSALFRRKPNQLIHHSDRGSQYTSDCFQKMSEKYGITLSMNDKGCYDNAVIESFFHTLKTELIYLKRFESKQEVKSALFEYIEIFYNRQRIHSTLEYTSPEAFENNYKEKNK
jgi:putative transposase